MSSRSAVSWRAASLFLGLALGSALLSGGCSEPALPAPPLQTLDLALAPDAGPLREREVVQRFTLADERESWRLEAETVTDFEREADASSAARRGVRLVSVAGRAPLRLTRAGRYDTAQFDHVSLLGSFGGEGGLQIVFRAGGAELGRSALIPLTASPETTEAVVPVPLALRAGASFDELVLELRGDFRMLIAEAVELGRQPAARYLPAPDGAAERVWIDHELRSGHTLAPGRALTARAVVPTGAPRLDFSIGLPRALVQPGAPGTVRVAVEGGGKTVAHEQLLPDLRESVSAWQRVELDLGALAGREVGIRFELAMPGGGDGACLVAEPKLTSANSGRPPVLLITTDTHRGDHLGAAKDGAGVATPELDALAQRGVFFERCFTWTNSTNPSHVALMTATHPRDTGILNNRQRLQERAGTLAERFHDAGYATWAVVSAVHLLDDTSGLGQGFDRMTGSLEVWDAPETIAHAQRWMEEAGGRPFFLWLHVFDVHWPYHVPEELARLYAPTRPASEREPWPKRLRDSGLAAAGDVESLRGLYKSEVTFLDTELGRLFRFPELANAVIAIVGDHGESLGTHGIYFDHAGLYPASLHVPLILSWPGGPRGKRVANLVRQTDLGRTLLDLAGLEDQVFPGEDLRRFLGEGAPPDVPHFALHARGLSASITMGGYHLILELVSEDSTQEDRPRAHHQVELYDLGADPLCEHDLAAAEPERVKGLRAALVRWLLAAQDLGWNRDAEISAAMDAQLDQLGYAETGGLGAAELWVEDGCERCKAYE